PVNTGSLTCPHNFGKGDLLSRSLFSLRCLFFALSLRCFFSRFRRAAFLSWLSPRRALFAAPRARAVLACVWSSSRARRARARRDQSGGPGASRLRAPGPAAETAGRL